MAASKRNVYFDACCFIDLAASATKNHVNANHTDHVFWCRKLLDGSRDGIIQVFTSAFSIVECLGVQDVDRNIIINPDIQRLFNGMLLSGTSGVLPIQPSPLIFEQARDLRWKHDINLKGADAVHVASAIFVGCQDFVTTDGKTIGRKSNIPKLKKLGLSVVRGDDLKGLLPDSVAQYPLGIDAEERRTDGN